MDPDGMRTFIHRSPEGGTYRDVRQASADEELLPNSADLAGFVVRLSDLA